MNRPNVEAELEECRAAKQAIDAAYNQRRLAAFHAWRAGATFRQIGDALGVTGQHARLIVHGKRR